jgi:hypothetical protein
MTHIFFWLSFGCSLNHIFLTLFPSDQLLDQLKKHNCSPIDRLSMICSKDHHNKFITKILYLILLVDNGQDGSYPIGIFGLHFFYNPPFINVVSIWNFVSYICQCYYSIKHICLIWLCLPCMTN